MKENHANGNVKERIIETATKFFSEKGYDGAKMNEIALAADVNKALIYYYFPSKQAILDYIVENFFNDMMDIGMDFIKDIMIRMIKDGRLDIMADRMRFTTREDMLAFREKTFDYYRRVLTHMMAHRDVLRVILAEALRSGEQRDALFRFFTSAGENSGGNPIFAAVSSADPDFNMTKGIMFQKFFFALMPLINFVVFHEEYKAASGMSDGEMRDSYQRSLETLYAGYFTGRDILMDPAFFGEFGEFRDFGESGELSGFGKFGGGDSYGKAAGDQ